MSFTIEIRGKFPDPKKLNDMLSKQIRQAVKQEVHNIAQEFHDDLVGKIERQEFHHIPLKPGYREAKIKAGLDPRILIATGDYISGIQVEDTLRGTAVGLSNTAMHNSGLTFSRIGKVHEYGVNHIPARPHWRPTVEIFRRRRYEFERRIKKLIKSLMP